MIEATDLPPSILTALRSAHTYAFSIGEYAADGQMDTAYDLSQTLLGLLGEALASVNEHTYTDIRKETRNGN